MKMELDSSRSQEKLPPSEKLDECPLASGVYHGFLLNGEVILKLMDNMAKGKSTDIVACPVARLFP
jgi:hypothetical protein